jgi:hypothetical protein
MNATLSKKIIFWAAICVSCVWLIFTIVTGLAADSRFFAGGFRATGRDPLEILIASAFALQPLAVLFLIVRAIRLRGEGRQLRIVARALYPLAPAVLLFGYVKALLYLDSQFEMRMELRRRTGSMTYLCWSNSPSGRRDPKKIGAPILRLIERRHPGQSSTWTVVWPGKKPIAAASFQASTGNIGGSEGIAWKDSHGRSMVAYLLFSDLVSSSYGTAGFLLLLVQSDVRESTPNLGAMRSTNFDCKPDAAYYQE